MQSQGIAAQGGVGWFFRAFESDPSWPGQFAELHLEATNFPVPAWPQRYAARQSSRRRHARPLPRHRTPPPGNNLLCVRLAMTGPGEELVGEPPPSTIPWILWEVSP